MPDLCCQYNVGDMKMNEPLQDTLTPISITGLHGRPISGTVIPLAGTSGSKKRTHQFRGRVIQVRAIPLIVANPGIDGDGINIARNLTEYNTRLNDLMDAWTSFLESKLNTTFTLSYTPTGGSPVSLTVTYGLEGGEFDMEAEGENAMFAPIVRFTLFAESG